MPTWTTFDNSPSVGGTEVIAGNCNFIVPANANSVSVVITAWSGANGGGSHVTVTSMTAIIRNVSGSADVNPVTVATVFSVTSTSAAGSNGTNVLAAAYKITNGAALGSVQMDITYTTGHDAHFIKIRVGGAWSDVPSTAINVRVGGAWVRVGHNLPGNISIRQGGAWRTPVGS